MKFLHKHRNDILRLIYNHGFTEHDFDFVKKRGRIHVIHKASKSYFSYFKKKETSIHPITKQWQQNSYYKYQKSNQRELVIDNWLLVVEEMQAWMSGLGQE